MKHFIKFTQGLIFILFLSSCVQENEPIKSMQSQPSVTSESKEHTNEKRFQLINHSEVDDLKDITKGQKLMDLGNYHLINHDFIRSLPYFIKALDYTKNESDKRDFLFNLYHLCSTFSMLRDLDSCIFFGEKYLENRDGVKNMDTNCDGFVLNNLGTAYMYKDFPKKAIICFLSSLETMTDELARATIFHNLGLLYSKVKDYENSVEFHLSSREVFISKFGELHDNTILSTFDLANALRDNLSFEQAIDYYEKALAAANQVFDKEDHRRKEILEEYAKARCQYGETLLKSGKHREALIQLNLGKIILEEEFDEGKFSLGMTYNFIGNIHFEFGDMVTARQYFTKAFTVFYKNVEEHRLWCYISLRNVSLTYEK